MVNERDLPTGALFFPKRYSESTIVGAMMGMRVRGRSHRAMTTHLLPFERKVF
jgi:hypothetical protein